MIPLDNNNFSFDGVEDKLSSSTSEGFDRYMKELNLAKQVSYYEAEGWKELGGYDVLSSEKFGFCNNEFLEEGFDFSKYQQQKLHQQSTSDYGLLDGFDFNADSLSLQTCIEEIAKVDEIQAVIPDVEAKKTKEFSNCLASLKLLNNYGGGLKRLSGERIIEPSIKIDTTCKEVAERKLSTNEILRTAGARYIQSHSQTMDFASLYSHPFEWSFHGLSYEEEKDVELVEFLFDAVENLRCQQFERASKLIKLCNSLSSNTGNPIQRIVYHFSEGLREKIDRDTGRMKSKGLREMQEFNLDEALMRLNETILAYHRNVPFSQLAQFAGIQAVVEHVAESKKVHIIDLGIRNGMQWTILMQALASRTDCPIELLKISAVGAASKDIIEETGERLSNFAESMNLPFVFKIVMMSDMLDLKEDLFELDGNETVAVLSDFILRSMVGQPNQLESVMTVMRNINPCLMLISEVEGNHNSRLFVNRFIESLFYYGAYFDSLDAFMRRDDPNRISLESDYFGYGIRNLVATEGEERKIRHVTIDVWRSFFARFGMEEIELSSLSLYHAKLVMKNFSCESSCTLDVNGKSLLIGWKGTPIQSLSVWKFVS